MKLKPQLEEFWVEPIYKESVFLKCKIYLIFVQFVVEYVVP